MTPKPPRPPHPQAAEWAATHVDLHLERRGPSRRRDHTRRRQLAVHLRSARPPYHQTAPGRRRRDRGTHHLSADPLGLSAAPNHHAFVPNPFGWLDPLGLKYLDHDDQARHDSARAGPHLRPGVRHPPPPGARQGRQPARRMPGHRASPALVRPGARPAGRAHRPSGPGTGWDLHEYRHSSLTHLGEQGASLWMLMAKSRHKKPENVRRYFKPSPEAIAELTSLLAPGGSNR
jgi:hypothetical protein